MSGAPPAISVGLVLVSHSGNLAKGAVEVAAQMAPDVTILPAGGTDDDGIGTSFDRVSAMVGQITAAGSAVLILADLGSALMTAESVVEFTGGDVEVADVPFVEGAVAAAVAAQGGADLAGTRAAATSAIDVFTRDRAPADPPPSPTPQVDAEAMTRTLTLTNSLGLHARPAALVARIVAEHDASVTLNGVDAASVLALMALALPTGAEVTLRASGPAAEDVMGALVEEFEAGFGED